MNKFVYMLLAFKMYVKQYHWLSAGYENHILADKLEEDLDDYIDEAAEFYNVNNDNPDPLFAKHILDESSNLLNASKIYNGSDMSQYLNSLLSFASEIIEECYKTPGAEGPVAQAYSDYYSRLSSLMVKKCYLINLQNRRK